MHYKNKFYVILLLGNVCKLFRSKYLIEIISKMIFTNDLKKTHLAYHRIGIYLAHIITPIILLHTINMKQPCFLIVMRHGKPGYFHDHMFVNSEQHLTTNMDPCHLKRGRKQIFKAISL